MFKVLDETQPWPIDIGPPEEPPRSRKIEALEDGAVVATWQWRDEAWHNPGSFARGWPEIVATCVGAGWALRSVPVLVPLDAGTAAMVRKQIEAHITLPPFVRESCQFDRLGPDSKDEWRAIFQAGLDAYLAAGGGRCE